MYVLFLKLTDRQKEIIYYAVHHGYFEIPRKITAEQIVNLSFSLQLNNNSLTTNRFYLIYPFSTLKSGNFWEKRICTYFIINVNKKNTKK
ncbi:MAG: helix-turn-helix domain-containing protein [Promethearchaeota archaeon]